MFHTQHAHTYYEQYYSCMFKYAHKKGTAHRITKSAQTLIHFTMRKQSFHTAYPMVTTATGSCICTLLAKCIQITVCRYSNIQLGLSPHLSSYPYPFLIYFNHTNRKMLGKKKSADENKSNPLFYFIEKSKVFAALITLKGLTEQTAAIFHTIAWTRVKSINNCVSDNTRISSVKLIKKKCPLSCVLIKQTCILSTSRLQSISRSGVASVNSP